MARVAFVMDKLLRKIGLSGRSIVPMLIGFGCTVPGVMASRTLSSERDRKMTIMLTPFMSCSAKLPIYAFFTAAFFSGEGCNCNDWSLFLRNSDGNPYCTCNERDDVQRRTCSVCYGASELSYAGSEKCWSASLGESKGFPAESIYRYFWCNDRDLVPAEL